jgi:hypothetical protein
LFPSTIRKENALLAREAEKLKQESYGDYGPRWNPDTLGQRATYALTDSELQRAYPDLMRQTIVRTNQDLDGAFGGYAQDRDSLSIAPPEYIARAVEPSDRDPRGTLLHELQHAVQGHEGFARGSNPTRAKSLLYSQRDADAQTARDRFAGMLHTANPNLQKIMEDYDTALYYSRPAVAAKLAQQAADAGGVDLIQARNAIDAIANKDITDADAYSAYERHLGELEARLVQGRRDWTTQERKVTPPWAMPEYIPNESQIKSFTPAPINVGDVFSQPSLKGLLAFGERR